MIVVYTVKVNSRVVTQLSQTSIFAWEVDFQLSFGNRQFITTTQGEIQTTSLSGETHPTTCLTHKNLSWHSCTLAIARPLTTSTQPQRTFVQWDLTGLPNNWSDLEKRATHRQIPAVQIEDFRLDKEDPIQDLDYGSLPSTPSWIRGNMGMDSNRGSNA